MFTPPAEVEAVTAAFASLFTRPSWRRAQALLCGVLLAPANHALTSALRALGLSADPHFQNYHRVLNRARWSAHQAAGILLRLLLRAFVPAGPVVLGLDETVERRRGAKIQARHLPRCGAFQPRVFPEDQRPALVLACTCWPPSRGPSACGPCLFSPPSALQNAMRPTGSVAGGTSP